MLTSDEQLIAELRRSATSNVDVISLFEIIANAHSEGTDEIPRLLLARYYHLAFGGGIEQVKALKLLSYRIERRGGRIRSDEPDAERILNHWISENREYWETNPPVE